MCGDPYNICLLIWVAKLETSHVLQSNKNKSYRGRSDRLSVSIILCKGCWKEIGSHSALAWTVTWMTLTRKRWNRIKSSYRQNLTPKSINIYVYKSSANVKHTRAADSFFSLQIQSFASERHSYSEAVWPVKSCQMSVKVAQKWFHHEN